MPGHRSVTEEYASLASSYDRRWWSYTAATASATLNALVTALALDTAPPEDRPLMLDIACGTGELLYRLQQRFPDSALSGCDLTPAMLKQARKKLGDTTELTVANAERLPFSSAGFSGCACSSAIQFVADPLAVFRESYRVLQPNGCFVLTAWVSDQLSARLYYRLLRWWQPAIQSVLACSDYQQLLESAGFVIEDTRPFRVGLCWQLATITARKPADNDTAETRRGTV